jgi:hypothetical protein
VEDYDVRGRGFSIDIESDMAILFTDRDIKKTDPIVLLFFDGKSHSGGGGVEAVEDSIYYVFITLVLLYI